MSRRKVRIRKSWAEATYYRLQAEAAAQRMGAIAADPARLAAFTARQAETKARRDRRMARRAS